MPSKPRRRYSRSMASFALYAVMRTDWSMPFSPYTTMSLMVAYLTAWRRKCRRLTFSNDRGFGNAKVVSPVVRLVVKMVDASKDETRRAAGGLAEMDERELDVSCESEAAELLLVEDDVADDHESVDEASPRRSRLRVEPGLGSIGIGGAWMTVRPR